MVKTKKNYIFKTILEYLGMTIGAALAAFALEEFLVPNSILDGGINGISIIVNKLTGFRLGILIFCLNIPFLYIGYKSLGKRFLIKSLYAMSLFSILVEVFEEAPMVTDDIILALVYGGVILGFGVGLIIKCGGCVDGTESVAIVISKKTSFSVGQIVLFFNLIIFGVAGFIFGVDRALYSLLTYFITYKIIDLVSEGLEKGKAVMIISNAGDKIAKDIYSRLGRTSTFLEGTGFISGEKSVLYVVVTRLEISEIRRIVSEEDESAFVTISDVAEIIGKHIKSTKELDNINDSKNSKKNNSKKKVNKKKV